MGLIKLNEKLWISEEIKDAEMHLIRVKNVVFEGETEFQKIGIYDTEVYGKCLLEMEKLQACEFDEFIYHEQAVHPAFSLHPNPSRALIFGCGDMGTLREMVRYKRLKKITMVDIDREGLEINKKYLPSFHHNSFKDERVDIITQDALDFIRTTQDEKYDIVIMGLSEPIKDSPSCYMYTLETFSLIKNNLCNRMTTSITIIADLFLNLAHKQAGQIC